MSQDYAIMTETSPATPPRKGRPLLAWLVIFAVVAFILWRYEKVSPQQRQRYDLVTMRLEGRYLMGATELAERFLGDQKSGRQQLYKEAQKLNRSTYPQRLRFVVLAGELKGAGEAREKLHEINRKYRDHCGELPPEEAETAQLLDHLYAARIKNPKAASLP